MLKITRFCVQPYMLRGEALVPGEAMHFYYEPDARRAAQAMLKRAHGVELYFIAGEPVIDLWQRPVLLDVFGEVGPCRPIPQPSVPVPLRRSASSLAA